MSKSKPNIDAELRKAIAKAQRDGQTLYAIAKLAGMPQSQLGRVATGETVPTLTTAERIAKAIGYRLALVVK